jgi:hypothetical protein
LALNDDEQLINDYLQWRAVKEATIPDYTPQAFMRERVMEIAVDRIEETLQYLDKCAVLRMEPSKHKIREILEGTGNGYEEEVAENREDSGQQPDKEIVAIETAESIAV